MIETNLDVVDSPKCNAQSPDRLHLQTRAFGSSDPVAVIDFAILVKTAPKSCGKSVC